MKRLLCAVCLLASAFAVAGYSQVATGDLAWAPSQPDSGPVLDYVRRVLTCDSQECTLKIVRSQEELMDAMQFDATTDMQVIHMRQSTDGGKTWTTRDVTVPVYKMPLRLMIGSCFGADLPLSVAADGGDLRLVKVNQPKPIEATAAEHPHP